LAISGAAPTDSHALSQVKASKSASDVVDKFPFVDFFSNAPEPVFKEGDKASYEDAMRAAEGLVPRHPERRRQPPHLDIPHCYLEPLG